MHGIGKAQTEPAASMGGELSPLFSLQTPGRRKFLLLLLFGWLFFVFFLTLSLCNYKEQSQVKKTFTFLGPAFIPSLPLSSCPPVTKVKEYLAVQMWLQLALHKTF